MPDSILSVRVFIFGLLVTLHLGCGDSGEGDLPPLSLDTVEGKGEVDTIRSGRDLDWDHRLDKAPSTTGWTAHLGSEQTGVAPGMSISVDWDQSLPPVVWRQPIGRGYSSLVISDDGRLILTHRVEDLERIECFDALTGESQWSHDQPTQFEPEYTKYTDGPISTPIIEGDFVYALGVQGLMRCLRLDTGEPVWIRDLAEDLDITVPSFGIGTSPIIDGDRLIVMIGAAASDAGLLAIDKRDGSTVWQSTPHEASYATPKLAKIHGLRHLFCLTNAGLVSVDPDSGDLRWSIDFRSRIPDSENASSPVVLDDCVVVSAYGMGCLCVRINDEGGYEELWRDKRVLDSHYNNLIALNDRVYGFSAIDRTFRCVDADTGELISKWRSELRRGYTLKIGGTFLVYGEHGELAAVRLKDGQLDPISLTQDGILEYPCYSAPSFWNGFLFARNESEMVCVDLRDEGARKDAESAKVQDNASP